MFKELNILKLFFETPSKEYNVREIARKLKIAPATASKDLDSLSNMNILEKRKERNFTLFKANFEGDLYLDLKVFYNIRKLKDTKLIEEINKFYGKPSIILFGSMSQGLDREHSDIDLLIISEKVSEFPLKEKYEKLFHRNIHLFVYRKISDEKNKHLINNMINGILLQGEIKWI